MGENDSVKSTIIESLAISSGLSAEGGTGSALFHILVPEDMFE